MLASILLLDSLSRTLVFFSDLRAAPATMSNNLIMHPITGAGISQNIEHDDHCSTKTAGSKEILETI